MKRTCILLLGFALLAVAAKREWKTGKVVDSGASKTYLPTDGGGVLARPMTLTETQILIVGNDFSYVASATKRDTGGMPIGTALISKAVNHGACRYIVGDPIQYAQEKGTLYVKDADGKECKLEIARQERVPKK